MTMYSILAQAFVEYHRPISVRLNRTLYGNRTEMCRRYRQGRSILFPGHSSTSGQRQCVSRAFVVMNGSSAPSCPDSMIYLDPLRFCSRNKTFFFTAALYQHEMGVVASEMISDSPTGSYLSMLSGRCCRGRVKVLKYPVMAMEIRRTAIVRDLAESYGERMRSQNFSEWRCSPFFAIAMNE